MQLSDEELQNLTLLEIEKLLQENRRSLKDFPSLPFPNGCVSNALGNRLIYVELNYDVTDMTSQYTNLFLALTGNKLYTKKYLYFLYYFLPLTILLIIKVFSSI